MKGDPNCPACRGTGVITDPAQTFAGRDCTSGLVTVSVPLTEWQETLSLLRECLTEFALEWGSGDTEEICSCSGLGPPHLSGACLSCRIRAVLKAKEGDGEE